MKKIIRFLIVCLAPIVILITYSNLFTLARLYSGTYYDILPVLVTVIAGNALIGVTVFFICKNTLKQTSTSVFPAEFLVGILLVIFPMLGLFIGISLPMFFFPEMSIGMSLMGLFVGIYTCLFIAVFRRRRKALKAQKAEQNNQLQQ